MRSIAEFRFHRDRLPIFVLGSALTIRLLLQGILSVGIAALNHEARNDSMKDSPVIEPFFRQLDEIFNMLGSHIRIKLYLDVAEFRFDNGPRPFRHFSFLSRG